MSILAADPSTSSTADRTLDRSISTAPPPRWGTTTCTSCGSLLRLSEEELVDGGGFRCYPCDQGAT